MYRDVKGRTFEDIIKLCRDYNIKLNLTTNGSFHSPQGHSGMCKCFDKSHWNSLFCFLTSVSEWAHLLVPVLSDVKFSWNGVTKKTQELIMKHSKFDRQVLTATFVRQICQFDYFF